MIIILNGYQVINRPADRQQNDDGDITIIIQCTMKLSSVLWNGRDHACVIGGVGGHMMILQSTWTGWRWRCTIFVAQMGVAGRAGRALQPSDSFLTLISEICCIHIYIYTLSYLQYIHKYTIHTIYTDIYIPTIYTDIYKYIRLYTNIYIYMKEGWLQIVNTWQSCETHCCLFHCMWETSIYVIDLDWTYANISCIWYENVV